MTSLFSLTDQYRQLMVLAESETDIPEEVIADTLEGLGGELQLKAQNVARFVLNQDAMADAIEGASKAMMERARRLRKRNDSMRHYLLTNMQAAGMQRIESPEIVLAIKNNPESVVIVAEDELPGKFMVQPDPPPKRPDKTAIKAAIKAGEDVPGARLERGQRLEIKP